RPGTTAAAGTPASATSHRWSTKANTTTDTRSATLNLTTEAGEAQTLGAAEAARVSVRCARKWVGRFRVEGERGLADRSSAPHLVGNRIRPIALLPLWP